MDKSIFYDGRQVSVSKEVAEFLEGDIRRQASQDRSDRRHLSKSEFETVLHSQQSVNMHSLEDIVLKNLCLQSLQKIIATLSEDEQRLIQLYFYHEMSMEEIGKQFGISKMAVSKRLKKLYVKIRGLL